MVSEVEKLIKEQEAVRLQLSLLNNSQKTLDAILLEQQTATDEFTRFSTTVKKLSNTIKVSLGNFQAPIVDVTQDGDFRDIRVVNVEDFAQAQTVVIPEILEDFAPVIQNNNELPLLLPPPENLPAVVGEAEEGNLPVVALEDSPATPLFIDESVFKNMENTGEMALLRLTNVDRGVQRLVSFQDSLIDDVRGTSSDIESNEKTKSSLPEVDTSGFSLSSLFGLGKGGKRIKGVLGKVGKALKVGGAVLGTGLFLKDLFDGFTNDKTIEDITGKAKSDLSDAERSAASLANGISGLSFGLLDASTVFETITPAIDLMQKGIDQIFDPEIGLFGTLTGGLFRAIDAFSEGEILEGISVIADSFKELPARMFEVIGEWMDTLLSFLPESVGKSLTSKLGDIKGLASGAAGFVSGLFGFGKDDEESEISETIPSGAKKERPTLKTRPQPKIFKAIKENNEVGIKNISPSIVNVASRANKISKERFEEARKVRENNVNPAPIIIDRTEKQSKKITRESANPDLKLALLNSGGLDS